MGANDSSEFYVGVSSIEFTNFFIWQTNEVRILVKRLDTRNVFLYARTRRRAGDRLYTCTEWISENCDLASDAC